MANSRRTLQQLIRDANRGSPEPPSIAYEFSGGRKYKHKKQPYTNLTNYPYVDSCYWDRDYAVGDLNVPCSVDNPTNLILNDTFTDTDGLVMSSHTPDAGTPWNIITGFPRILTNKGTTTNDTDVAQFTQIYAADGIITATMGWSAVTATNFGRPMLMFRQKDSSSYWFVGVEFDLPQTGKDLKIWRFGNDAGPAATVTMAEVPVDMGAASSGTYDITLILKDDFIHATLENDQGSWSTHLLDDTFKTERGVGAYLLAFGIFGVPRPTIDDLMMTG